MNSTLRKSDYKNDQSLSQNLSLKIEYLKQLHDALVKHNDLSVYKLLNTTKYFHVMKHKRYTDDNDYAALTKDLRPELSHHLSHHLIVYLKKTYPFFYYHEDYLGHYQVYFGDWWGHKLFGSLDVINVKFNFDDEEYGKLRQAFDNQDVDTHKMKVIQRHDQKLIKLVKTQNQRTNQESELKTDLKANRSQTRMPWNSARINADHSKMTNELNKLTRQDKQVNEAKSHIETNHQKMLELSKENTVINYEKQCVKKYFGGLQQFSHNNKHLYYNYISNSLARGND